MILPPTLPAYEREARARLTPDVAAYFLGAAGQGGALRANLDDLARIRLRPRVLRDLRGGGTALSLFGQQIAHPILAAPMAWLPLLHEDGEAGLAAAVTAQGGTMVLSAQSASPMSDARAAGPGCGWFQLYWQGSREATGALADRAEKAGFHALVLTVDAPVSGVRDAEIETGFTLPEGLRAVNLDGLPVPEFAPPGPEDSMIFDRITHILPGWDDLAWLCAQTRLPVLVKGILDPGDAVLAVRAGVAGIIVSNHGGRVLQGAVSAVSALPGVVAAVDGAVPVLMDGGIRRGEDVLRALALGADAVLAGRVLAQGLAVAGAQGASHVLRLLRDELEIAMALTGCRDLSEITADRVISPF